MAVDPEEFAEEAVEAIVSVGSKIRGDQFGIDIEDCPILSKLVITSTPLMPGRVPVEDVPGQQGVTINETGPKKSGGMFPVAFTDGLTTPALTEVINWEKNCHTLAGKKTVRIFAKSELEVDSPLDVTYTHCWPDIEEVEFDAENKQPIRINLNIHFANRKWTK